MVCDPSVVTLVAEVCLATDTGRGFGNLMEPPAECPVDVMACGADSLGDTTDVVCKCPLLP